MSFTSLSGNLQDLIMVGFTFFGKLFLIFVLLGFSLYRISTKGKEEESPYLLTSLTRVITYFLSIVSLSLTPLFVLVLYPQVDLSLMLQWMFIFYTIAFFIVSVVFLVNLLYFAPVMLAKFGGYNPDAERTSKVMNHFESLVADLPLIKRKNRKRFFR